MRDVTGCIVVLGSRFVGKTYCARRFMGERARREAGALRQRRVSCDDVSIPVWVAASALGDQGDHLPLGEALLGAMGAERLVVPPLIRSWLAERIGGPHSVVAIDALDGADGHTRVKRVTDRVAEIAARGGSMIVTCRSSAWPYWSAVIHRCSRVRLVELVPFNRWRQDLFVLRFFRLTEPVSRRGRMQRHLFRNASMRHLCRTPSFLADCCMLVAGGWLPDTGPETDADMFNPLIDALLERARAPAGSALPWGDESVSRALRRRFLAAIAYALLRHVGQPNRFTLAEWQIACRHALGDEGTPCPLAQYLGCSAPGTGGGTGCAGICLAASKFLDALLLLGIIADVRGAGTQQFAFADPTLFEFLAAEGWMDVVRRRGAGLPPALTDRPLGPVRAYPDLDRVRYIGFIAGAMKDATPLLRHAETMRPKDGSPGAPIDLFAEQTLWKCRMVGSALDTPAHEVDAVVADLMGYWRLTLEPPLDAVADHARAMFAELARNPAGATSLVDRLRGHWRTGRVKLRIQIARALGEVRTDGATDALLEFMAEERRPSVRLQIVLALERIGSDRASDGLQAYMRGKKDSDVTRAIQNALQKVEAEASIPNLPNLFPQEKRVEVRCNIALVLGRFRCEEAVRTLLNGLATADDRKLLLCIIYALGRIGSESAVDALLRLLADEQPPFPLRGAILIALGRIGSERAVEPLIDQLKCALDRSDIPYAVALAGTLGQIASQGAVDPLLEMLRGQKEDRVAATLLWALGRIGSERAVPGILEWKKNAGHRALDWIVAQALGRIASQSAVPEFLNWAKTETRARECEEIARAFGRIGAPGAVPQLRCWLQRMGDPRVRAACAEALASHHDDWAFDCLCAMFPGELNPHTRAAIARALRRLSVHFGRSALVTIGPAPGG